MSVSVHVCACRYVRACLCLCMSVCTCMSVCVLVCACLRACVYMGVYYAHTYVEGCPCVCIMHILRGVSMCVNYAHT